MHKMRRVIIYCVSLIVTIIICMSLSTIIVSAEEGDLTIEILINNKEYDGLEIDYDINYYDFSNNLVTIDASDIVIDFYDRNNLSQSLGASAPTYAGEYQIRVEYIGLDYNTVVQTSDFDITKRRINTLISSTIIYGETPEWDVRVTQGSLANGDTIDDINIDYNYMDDLVNVGSYEDYNYIINSDNYQNATYSTWYLNILPKNITIEIDDLTIIYGSSIEPTYQLATGYTLENEDNIADLNINCLIDANELSEDLSVYNQGEHIIGAQYDNNNYNITFIEAKLTINSLIIYLDVDGQAVYGDIPEYNYILNSNLAYDDSYEDLGITYTVSSNKPSVGIHRINLTNSNVNYDIVLSESYLVVTPRVVTAKIDNKEITYGTPPISMLSVTLVEGDYAQGEEEHSLYINYYNYTNDVTPEGQPYIVNATSASTNYDVEFIPGELTILPKDIIVNVPNTVFTYGENKNFNYLVESVLPYDDTKYSLNIVIDANETSVGQYDALMSYDNNNYNIVFRNGKYTIQKKRIEIKINDISYIVYGEQPNYNCALWNSSLEYEDTIEDLNITYVPESLNSGERYTISANYSNTNYDIKFREGRINIAKRPITVILDDENVTYGESPSFTYRLDSNSSLASWDTLQALEISLTSNRVDADIAEYPIAYSYNNSNYNITFVQGYYTISPREITIRVKDIVREYGQTREFDESDLEIIEGSMGYSEPLSILGLEFTTTSGKAVGTVVGEYDLTVSTNNSNYDVRVIDGSVTIEKRRVNLTIEDIIKEFGDKDPKLAFEADVENLVFSGNLQREKGEKAGVYEINLGNLDAGDNYELVLQPATLTIKGDLPVLAYVSLSLLGFSFIVGAVVVIKWTKVARII